MSIKLFHSMNPRRAYPIGDQKLYSDGTPMIKGQFDLSLDSMVVQPNSLMEFINAMFLVDSLEEQGADIKHLILPYVPGARQDRINPTGDVLFTIKSVANIINAKRFKSVSVFDPHSPVTPALINRCKVLPVSDIALAAFSDQNYAGIIAPDLGAAKRAEEVAAVLKLPVYFGAKHRDVSTGKLDGFAIKIPFGHYLVVDDICDGGGTFVGLGEKIKDNLATADLYVSHGLFSKGTDTLSKYYGTIYTTNSLELNDRNKVEIVPVLHRLMELI